jgi:hypothetical protein
MPAVPVWTVSSHWSNIDPDCRVRARCYPMRMKPSWIVSFGCISAQAAQIYTQIWWVFLLGGAAERICLKIYIVCFHVGQMLFAGNKYLLLKRITVRHRFLPTSLKSYLDTHHKKPMFTKVKVGYLVQIYIVRHTGIQEFPNLDPCSKGGFVQRRLNYSRAVDSQDQRVSTLLPWRIIDAKELKHLFELKHTNMGATLGNHGLRTATRLTWLIP